MDKNIDLFKSPAGIAVLILAIIGVISFFVYLNGYTDTPVPTTTQMQVAEPEGTETESFDSIRLSGSGNDSSNTVTLERGVYRVKGTHQGEGNFMVDFQGDEPENMNGAVNETGNYSGVSTLRIFESGEYIVDVMAGGEWTLEITK